MRFTIPLPPSHYQRPGNSARGGRYNPHGKALLDWHGLIRNQLRLQGEPIIEGPVAVRLHIGADSTDIEVIPVVGCEPCRPKGIRADIDNIAKFDLDAMNKLTYFDDVQVVDLSARFKGQGE